MAPLVVVTGSAGFVGSRVLAQLAARDDVRVRAVVHRTPPPAAWGSTVEVLQADLRHPGALPGVVRGADVLLHLAHRIHGSERELVEVNTVSTARLVACSQASGVRRLIRLSTTAVYGRASRHGASVQELAPAPESATSRSRSDGDDAVLAAGGLVVRPHLVAGRGDRWLIPRAVDIVRRMGWIDHGQARHSIIAVTELARALVACALPGGAAGTAVSGVLLAGPPVPAPLRQLVTQALQGRGLPVPVESRTLGEALAHPAGQGDARWHADLNLMGRDHFYDCTPFTELLTAGTGARYHCSAT